MSNDMGDNTESKSTKLGETYPANWMHCVIHLNPDTGEMHSDGDHRVRDWIRDRIGCPVNGDRASEMLWFLNDHPGIISPIYGSFMADCSFYMSPVSKEGCDKLSPIVLERGDARFEEFAHLLEFEEKDLPDAYVYVSYSDFYGKPWECDHVNYGCEVDFFAFYGTPKDAVASDRDYTKWNRYHGFNMCRTSFEDMLVSAANEVRRIFGPFDSNSFLTEEEMQNHKKVSPILFELAGDGSRTLGHNEEYIPVSAGMLNRRWLKWFWTTEWCQQNWKGTGEMQALAEDPSVQSVNPVEVKGYPWI